MIWTTPSSHPFGLNCHFVNISNFYIKFCVHNRQHRTAHTNHIQPRIMSSDALTAAGRRSLHGARRGIRGAHKGGRASPQLRRAAASGRRRQRTDSGGRASSRERRRPRAASESSTTSCPFQVLLDLRAVAKAPRRGVGSELTHDELRSMGATSAEQVQCSKSSGVVFFCLHAHFVLQLEALLSVLSLDDLSAIVEDCAQTMRRFHRAQAEAGGCLCW